MRRYLLGRTEMRSLFLTPLVAQFEALDAALSERRVDAVLVDVAFTGALPLLLRARPRPAVLVCGVGPLTLFSDDVPPFGMAWQPRLGAR